MEHPKARYINAATGQVMDHKPEDMTQLRGNLLVSKTHPQIIFRGKLDTLTALIVQTQITAQEQNQPRTEQALGELLTFVGLVLRAEVLGESLDAPNLLGLDSDALRYHSHYVKECYNIEHPIPNASLGRLGAELNYLRTQVRETELAAVHAFDGSRPDIVEGLNRLSSAVYILLCELISGR